MDKQRARTPEEQAYRKQSIVDALRRVLSRALYPLPSAQEIAAEARVTKGVVYHYFRSKEEIYLTLLLQESEQLITAVMQVLAAPTAEVATIRDVFVEACSNDILMYLGLIAPSVLESNASPEFARNFKIFHAGKLQDMADRWSRHEPALPLADLRNFLLRIYLMALTQWQHYHPSAAVLEAFRGRPKPWLLEGDLPSSVRQCFDWLWLGMKASTTNHPAPPH